MPFRPDNGLRDQHWDWLSNQWRQHYPDWELCTGTTVPREGPWIKGIAAERAIKSSTGGILVIADADIWVEPSEVLHEAVHLVDSGQATWVVPHLKVLRLSARGTEHFMDGQRHDLEMARGAHTGIAGGGMIVIRYDDWVRCGGYDFRFRGWGGEDSSFGRVADTLLGRHTRLEGAMWHLWHPPQQRARVANQGNMALVNRYKQGYRHPQLMRRLVEQSIQYKKKLR